MTKIKNWKRISGYRCGRWKNTKTGERVLILKVNRKTSRFDKGWSGIQTSSRSTQNKWITYKLFHIKPYPEGIIRELSACWYDSLDNARKSAVEWMKSNPGTDPSSKQINTRIKCDCGSSNVLSSRKPIRRGVDKIQYHCRDCGAEWSEFKKGTGS